MITLLALAGFAIISQMRLGIDARLNGYRGGGISQYTRNIIHALADLDRTGDYAILHAARPQTDPGNLTPAANFQRVNVYTPPHHRLERMALGLEISRLRLDVLHSPDFIPPLFGARRYIITVHDLNFMLFPKFQTPDSLAYYAGNIKAAVHKADHILTVSRATADDLCNLLNVPPEKITIQVEGVDPTYHPMSAEQIRPVLERFKLPSTYILFVGTIEPRKNISGLFEAYSLLKQQMPDAPPLVLAGQRGWLYEPILQKAKDLNLRDDLIWIENATVADLPMIYNGAAVLVMPSFYEGFGLPPLEAMACGIPTVVSNRSSLPEVVGDTGLLVDPDHPESITDALRRMLTENELRSRSSKAGLERAKLFTWTQAAKTALEVYQKVL